MSGLRRLCWLAVCGWLFTPLASGQWQQQWATHYGVPGAGDVAYSVVLDPSGNAYVAGISSDDESYIVQRYRASDGSTQPPGGWTATRSEPPGGGGYEPYIPAPPVLVGDWSANKLYMVGTDIRSYSPTLLLTFDEPNISGHYTPSLPVGGATWPQSAVLDTSHNLYIAGFARTFSLEYYPFVKRVGVDGNNWLYWNTDPGERQATERGTVPVALGPGGVYMAPSVYEQGGASGDYSLTKIPYAGPPGIGSRLAGTRTSRSRWRPSRSAALISHTLPVGA